MAEAALVRSRKARLWEDATSESAENNKTQMFLSFQLDVSKNLGKYPIMVVVGEI